jgi:myo-inositol-1(or 4)-monophosphatase
MDHAAMPPTQPATPNTTEPGLDTFLATAIAAARAAGDVIRDGARNRASLTIERKRANDFVSIVDKGAERAILDLIGRAHPDHAFHAEETGQSGGAATASHVWLIDPLDGTTNFLHGIPHYCVSIGLKRDGDMVVGVVYDPINERLFTATKGGGAHLDGERIRVSSRESLAESVIGTGIPFSDLSYVDAYMGSLRTIATRSAGIRRAGAAALDLAYVAAGWLDGFWEKNLNPWDVGAGAVLIEEAGGVITDFRGGRAHIDSGQVVTGAPGVHRALLDVIAEFPALAAPRQARE